MSKKMACLPPLFYQMKTHRGTLYHKQEKEVPTIEVLLFSLMEIKVLSCSSCHSLAESRLHVGLG